MINNNFFLENTITYISDKLFESKFIPDLKYWYEIFNLDVYELKKLKCDNKRDILLLESIFDNVKLEKINIIENVK